MKWRITHTTNGILLFIINKEYSLRVFKTKKGSKCCHLINVDKLSSDDHFRNSKEISEIEMLIIDVYELIKEFIPKIKKIPVYETCKNNYNKELLEFKEYFKELEGEHIEMLEQNSACGEIKE